MFVIFEASHPARRLPVRSGNQVPRRGRARPTGWAGGQAELGRVRARVEAQPHVGAFGVRPRLRREVLEGGGLYRLQEL